MNPDELDKHHMPSYKVNYIDPWKAYVLLKCRAWKRTHWFMAESSPTKLLWITLKVCGNYKKHQYRWELSLSMQVLINLLPNENAPLWPVEAVIPAPRPEDSPIDHLSNTAEAGGKLIKVVEAAEAEWLVVVIGRSDTCKSKAFYVCPHWPWLSGLQGAERVTKGCYIKVL